MIEDLHTYRPSESIPFSAEVFHAVIEQYNLDIWPLQLLCLPIVVSLAIGLLRTPDTCTRFALLFTGFSWLCLLSVFHWYYFQPINWSARYFAYLFAIQAMLFLSYGVFGRELSLKSEPSIRRFLGLLLFGFAALVPIGIFFGRDYAQLALFSWGMDNTVLGSLGFVLLINDRITRAILSLIPLLWLLISSVMHSGLYF